MNPNEYQRLAAKTICDQSTIKHRFNRITPNDVQLIHSVLGISGESGELSAAIEKWIWYGQQLDKLNVYEELGDLLWYIAEACTALNVSLEEVMEINIKKLKVRYPEKYTDKNALETNRDREAESKATSLFDPRLEIDFLNIDADIKQTGQGWAEPPETSSKELDDRFERGTKYGFDVARQVIDTYTMGRDSVMAAKFVEESERRCRAESSE